MGRNKKERTESFEFTMKSRIFEGMVAEEIADIKFQKLLKKGVIRTYGDRERIRGAAVSC